MGFSLTKAVSMTVLALLALTGGAMAQSKEHLGHVTDSYKDTPGKVGLATILEIEAKIAAEHAGYLLKDKKVSKSHATHIQNAINPEIIKDGPGKGYGVTKAAQGVVQHMGYVAKASDAKDKEKLHAGHIIASANNVLGWAQEVNGKILKFANPLMSDKDELETAEDIVQLTQWMLKGRDKDKDGKISWETGEGGVAQIKQHLALIDK